MQDISRLALNLLFMVLSNPHIIKFSVLIKQQQILYYKNKYSDKILRTNSLSACSNILPLTPPKKKTLLTS